MATREQIETDFTRYCRAMAEYNGWQTCLAIERRYGLDGYPPEVVTRVMRAGADGKDMDAEIDRILDPDAS